MDLINFNAIPIAYERSVYFLDKKELAVIKKIKYKPPHKGFYLSETISLLNDKALTSLKKFIIKKAKEYVRNVLEIKDQIYLTQSWSTLNPTNAFHEPHTHPNTFISLVYYAQCKEGSIHIHSDISSIRKCFNFHYTINRFNIYNSQIWELPVRTGDIVLFPGHIRHSSVPNRTQQDRIAVGANFFIKGTLGSKKMVSLITI
jgi:uncharacterized protein (TIGR02466 family)